MYVQIAWPSACNAISKLCLCRSTNMIKVQQRESWLLFNIWNQETLMLNEKLKQYKHGKAKDIMYTK